MSKEEINLPAHLREKLAFDEKLEGDQKQIDDLRFHRRVDKLVCGWSMLNGMAFTENQLNSLVDMLGDDFRAQAVKIHAHGVRVGKALENARLATVIARMIDCVEALGGCSDGNCRFISRRIGGMHTNGGCHCVDNAKQALSRLREAVGGE